MTPEDKCAAAYCVMFIGLAAQTSILGPTMLGISQTYGEGPEAAASLFNSTNTTHVGGAVALSESLMGRGIGYFLGTVFIGSAFDRWPQKSHVVLFCCCMACSLSTALIPLYTYGNAGLYQDGSNVGTGRWLLLFALLFQGIAAGTVDLGGNVLLTRHFASDVERLSPRMNLLHGMWGIGATIGPLLAVGIGLKQENLPTTYGAISIIGIALSLPILCLKSPPIKNRHGPIVIEIAGDVEDIDKDKDKDKEDIGKEQNTPGTANTTVTSDASSPAMCCQTTTPVAVGRIIVFLLLYYFMYAGIEHIMGDWIATFANIAPVNTTTETGALLVSLYFGSMSVGRLLSAIATSKPAWSRVLTPPRIIGGGLIIAFFSYIVLVAAGSYSIVPLIVSVAGIGLSFSSIYPMGLALAEIKIQPTGSQQSMFVSGAPMGGTIMPTLVGTLMREESALYFPWASLVLLILCGVAFVCVLLHTVGPGSPATSTPSTPATPATTAKDATGEGVAAATGVAE